MLQISFLRGNMNNTIEYKPKDMVFCDSVTGRISYRGAVGFYDNGVYPDEPSFFDKVLDLLEIVPVMNYLKEQFPNGWDIRNGELVSLEN